MGWYLMALGLSLGLWQLAVLTNVRGVRDRYLDWVTRSQARLRFMARADRAQIDYVAERDVGRPLLLIVASVLLIAAVWMLVSGVAMLIG